MVHANAVTNPIFMVAEQFSKLELCQQQKSCNIFAEGNYIAFSKNITPVPGNLISWKMQLYSALLTL